jgi:hypothetical protein
MPVDMTAQQQKLLDALATMGWELAGEEQVHEWWVDSVWRMRSIWSPQCGQFYLTFLVDPQLDLHRRRKIGEGVWAVGASAYLPASSEQAKKQGLFSLGHGWEQRLDGFISGLSRFRQEPMKLNSSKDHAL